MNWRLALLTMARVPLLVMLTSWYRERSRTPIGARGRILLACRASSPSI